MEQVANQLKFKVKDLNLADGEEKRSNLPRLKCRV